MCPSSIAQCVLAAFDSLPVKAKPRQRNEGVVEWVPLSGIVLSKDGIPLKCVSLGTGMKCLPQNHISSAQGTTLHDWHAEVVAIRAFNRWLMDECAIILSNGPDASSFLIRRSDHELSESEHQPFAIRDGVTIHMYCSDAPCGDASMELVMDAQEDRTPWQLPPSDNSDSLLGRGYFSRLGAVRRKPSRPDAPATLSKSCTDKLSLKQCTSLLSSIVSLLIHPRNAYLDTLVLPTSQYVPEAISRAFGPAGRMSAITEASRTWDGGYCYCPFTVMPTDVEFRYSRRKVQSGQKITSSNITAVYTPHWQEVQIGGVLQGRKQFDPRGASRICRRSMWATLGQIASTAAIPLLIHATQKSSYRAVKEDRPLRWRRQIVRDVKASALKGWVANQGDEEWSL